MVLVFLGCLALPARSVTVYGPEDGYCVAGEGGEAGVQGPPVYLVGSTDAAACAERSRVSNPAPSLYSLV